MKTCPNCHEEVEDSFDLCWNCYYRFSENRVDLPPEPEVSPDLECLRCKTPMSYAGEYKFLEGTRTGVLGSLFELLQNREHFDLYLCSKCGKVEFFTPLKNNGTTFISENL